MFVDTTFCLDITREARHGFGRATDKLRRLADTPLMASVFVICELQSAARASANREHEHAYVQRLTEHMEIIYPDASFAVAYAETDAALREKGLPVPTMALLIGTMARIRGVPLLTRESTHYRRIPGLVVESY